ncbi:MAG TPA: DUF3619 family protein [Rhodanobacteraceae bacterium]|nr:DUF3619 family protein [Rhodanobacteraceae bacterium]
MNPSDQNQPNDERWLERARALLDDSAENLDAATLSRLNRARQAALATRRKGPSRWAWSAALAGAAAAVFAVAIGLHQRGAAPVPSASLQPADIDVMTSDDDLDLAENLDFYAWLEKQPSGGPSG